MAYGFGATLGTGTTDRIDEPSTVAWPTGGQTFGVWAYRNGAGGANVGTIFQTATVIHYLRNNEGSTVMQMNISFSGGTQNTWTFPRPATGGWHHLLFTYDGDVTHDPVCYVDGVSQTVTNTNRTVGTVNTANGAISWGNRASDNATVWDGMLAEPVLYNRILTAGEIAAQAAGYSPRFMRAGILAYRPLLRGFNSPMFAAATANGTPVVQPHPRIIYPG